MLAAIGDIHLNKLSHRIPNFNDLVLTTLANTLKDAYSLGCEAVAILGDVFDTPYPDQDSQIALLNVLTANPTKIFIIPGNHDCADVTINSLKITKWTKSLNSNIEVITKPKIITISGMKIEMMPHPYVENMSKKADIAFAHFAVNGARGDNGFTVRTKNQPKGRFLLGDFHGAQSGKVKGCDYEYIGSLTQLSWEEKPKKSIVLLEDGEISRRKVNLSYRLKKVTVESDDELNALTIESDTFYYIKTKNGYILPKGWNLQYPNVVRQSAVGAKKDKRAELLAPEEIFTDPLANLEPYLLSKKHSPEFVASCMKLAKNKLRLSEAA